MKKLLEYIVKNLVDNPDAISIDEITEGSNTRFELKVDEPDMGKVIGKDGRIAQSVRLLLRAAGQKKGMRTDLKILG